MASRISHSSSYASMVSAASIMVAQKRIAGYVLRQLRPLPDSGPQRIIQRDFPSL